jgi:nicotinamidase-related amidase
MPKALTAAGKLLLTPKDHTLILIDFQSQMAFPTRSIDVILLRNNVSIIAQAAAGFGIPTIVTTVAKSFSGPLFPEVLAAFPDAKVYDRTSMNSWEDAQITDHVNSVGKGRVVLAGLWTSVCIVGPALSALEQGFEVFILTDACGDVSDEAHERAVTRMVQAGAYPMTSLQYLLELQRDWARAQTYDLTTGIARANAGGYGLGIQYARAMFGGEEGH